MEQKQIGAGDIQAVRQWANMVSGRIASPVFIGILSACCEESGSAQSLIELMKTMNEHTMNQEVLRLLKIVCDLVDIDYPSELESALNAPIAAAELVRELILDFEEILAEDRL